MNSGNEGSVLQQLEALESDALIELADFAGYEAFEREGRAVIIERRRLEAALVPSTGQRFNLAGYCVACQAPRDFAVGFEYATGRLPDGRPLPNWREHLICQGCGLNNRMRAAIRVVAQRVGPTVDHAVYITEATTQLYRWLARTHPKLVGSEFLGPDVSLGSTPDGIRHEDVTRLTFGDGTFDLILSFDVFEHVPDYRAGFRECYRCLRPDGTLVFTVPFVRDSASTIVRARVRPDGSVEHVLPAEYHGDPVNPAGGILCYYHFGWDMLEELRRVGFRHVSAIVLWSAREACLGHEQIVFTAVR